MKLGGSYQIHFPEELNLYSNLECAAACKYQQGQYQLLFAKDQQYVHLQLTYLRYPIGINTWTGIAFGHSMVIMSLIQNLSFDIFDDLMIPVLELMYEIFDSYKILY